MRCSRSRPSAHRPGGARLRRGAAGAGAQLPTTPTRSLVLDNGATGIVFPDVNTAADARRAVDACKFAPIGKRSVSGGYPVFDFRPVPLADSVRGAQRRDAGGVHDRDASRASPMSRRSRRSRASMCSMSAATICSPTWASPARSATPRSSPHRARDRGRQGARQISPASAASATSSARTPSSEGRALRHHADRPRLPDGGGGPARRRRSGRSIKRVTQPRWSWKATASGRRSARRRSTCCARPTARSGWARRSPPPRSASRRCAQHGTTFPDAAFEAAKAADGVILGPVVAQRLSAGRRGRAQSVGRAAQAARPLRQYPPGAHAAAAFRRAAACRSIS